MMKKPGKGKKNKGCEPVRKQHVDIFYAFHKAGFKPSARSFNVVQVVLTYLLTYSCCCCCCCCCCCHAVADVI
jgi:hypothetical protein